MGTSSQLAACLLLSISLGLLASNPDSETVQDSSSTDNQERQMKSQPMLAEDTETQFRNRDTAPGPGPVIRPGVSRLVFNKLFIPIRSGGYATKEVYYVVPARRRDRPYSEVRADPVNSNGPINRNAYSSSNRGDQFSSSYIPNDNNNNDRNNLNNRQGPFDRRTQNGGEGYGFRNPNRSSTAGEFSNPANTDFNSNAGGDQFSSSFIPNNNNNNDRNNLNNRQGSFDRRPQNGGEGYGLSNPSPSLSAGEFSNPANTDFNSNARGDQFSSSFISNNNNRNNLNNRQGPFDRRTQNGGDVYGVRNSSPLSSAENFAPNPNIDRSNESNVPILPNIPNSNQNSGAASSGTSNFRLSTNNRQGENIPARLEPSRNVYRNFNPQVNRTNTNSYGGYSQNQGNGQSPPFVTSFTRNWQTFDGQARISATESSRSDNGGNASKRSPDSNLFAGIVNDFAFKLVNTLNLDSNFVVSPLSVFIALSMCYLGSEGSTKAQMESILGLNLNSVHGERLHQGIKDLMTLVLPQSNTDYQLFLANGMFLGKNFTVSPQFEADMQRFYAAELKNLDFGNTRLSVAVTNDWVSRATKNMITKLTDSPPDSLTRLLILNAIYFKGTWKTQFPVDMTYSGRFFTRDGNDKMVQTMPLYGETFPLYRSDSHRHTFIKLPYQGDQISMIIALPFNFREEPMPSTTDQLLCYVRDAMTDTVLDTVAIPKFKFEYTASLKEPLMRLGITRVFRSDVVDLRRLRPYNDVFLSEIVHKAVVEVNEQGTTASASTAVRFVPLSYRNTTDFIANHPFTFYIMHEPSGLVLFYGKVYTLGVDEVPNNRRGPARG